MYILQTSFLYNQENLGNDGAWRCPIKSTFEPNTVYIRSTFVHPCLIDVSVLKIVRAKHFVAINSIIRIKLLQNLP